MFMRYGVEIGVQRGLFSKTVLEAWKGCKEYHLVDPWIKQGNYDDIANVNDYLQNDNLKITKENMKSFGSIPRFHRNFSYDAAKIFDDCYFDFVYIDGLHDYTGALNDMIDFWRTLRPGGIFAGHDFEDGNLPEGGITLQP